MRPPHDQANAPVAEIATDGACRYNPGPGGWAAVIMEGDDIRTISGGEDHTTNNRMELTAAIEGLSALADPARVTVYTDSRYVCDGITRWIAGWMARGWRGADGRPVRNRDLWERLVDQARRHEVAWTWCKGHAGHPYNELADRAAGLAVPRNVVRMRTERSCA
jgi:ribonuclease HI